MSRLLTLLCVFLVFASLSHGAWSQNCPNGQTPAAAKTADSVPAKGSVTNPANLPTAMTGQSEIVITPKQTRPENGWPRSNCPHLQSGLKNWHAASTWGGSVPSVSQNTITLPSNSKVIIRSCSLQGSATNPYKKIVVPDTSELIFDDVDLVLYVREIQVYGKLSIGSSTCRLFANIHIWLHGSRSDSSLLASDRSKTSKGIISDSGSIDMHGKLFFPTWTRLARTVAAGSDLIYLQDAVNWEVGQYILLTTTVFYDYPSTHGSGPPHQNEEFRIVAIGSSPEGANRVVRVDKPATYQHYAGPEYQGEVMLLSRRIKVQGIETNDNYGGHIQVGGTSTGRFSGVEVINGGQLNILARYPFHFHLLGECPSCKIQDCSTVHSQFRCYTIHGTNSTTLERNTAYNSKGNCYYLEDGVEEKNVLKFNMAAHINYIDHGAAGGCQGGETVTSSNSLLIPTDIAASGFYITNAYNTYVGNAASGGWSGFAFVNVPKPIENFAPASPNYNNKDWWDPMNRPTLLFDGNTAHSSGFYWGCGGGCLYVGGRLQYNGNRLEYLTGRFSRQTQATGGGSAWMKWTNLKTFLCQQGANHWGDKIEITNYEAHDTRKSLVMFGEAYAYNALVIGNTGNTAASSQIGKRSGFQFYDTHVKTMLNSWTFRNFYASDRGVLQYLTHSEQFLPQGINAVKGIKYENVDAVNVYIEYCGNGCPKTESMSARMSNMYDYDGGAVMDPGPKIVGSHRDWWNVGNDCKYVSAWKIWYCDWTTEREIAYLAFNAVGAFPGGPTQTTRALTGYVSQFGQNRSIQLGLWPGAAGISNRGWYFRLWQGAPKTWTIDAVLIPRGFFVVAAVKYPTSATVTSARIVSRWWKNNGVWRYWTIPRANSFSDIIASSETLKPYTQFSCPGSDWWRMCDYASTGGKGPMWWFDSNTGFLYVRVVNPAFYNVNQRSRDSTFERGGMRLWDVNSGFQYELKASCSGSGDFCWVSDSIPPAFTSRGSAGPLVTPSPTTPTTRQPTSSNGGPSATPRPVATPQPTAQQTPRPTPKPTTSQPTSASSDLACKAATWPCKLTLVDGSNPWWWAVDVQNWSFNRLTNVQRVQARGAGQVWKTGSLASWGYWIFYERGFKYNSPITLLIRMNSGEEFYACNTITQPTGGQYVNGIRSVGLGCRALPVPASSVSQATEIAQTPPPWAESGPPSSGSAGTGAESSSGGGNNSANKTPLIIGAVGGGVCLIILLICGCIMCSRAKMQRETTNTGLLDQHGHATGGYRPPMVTQV